MKFRVERLCEEDGVWYAWGVYDDADRAMKACEFLRELGNFARIVDLR